MQKTSSGSLVLSVCGVLEPPAYASGNKPADLSNSGRIGSDLPDVGSLRDSLGVFGGRLVGQLFQHPLKDVY